MKKILIAFMILLLVSCAPVKQPQQQSATVPKEETPIMAPAEKTDEKSVVLVVSPDIRDLIEKGETRTKSLSYNYKGPEDETETFKFYVKDGKIKYYPPRTVRSLDLPNSYDTIFVDKSTITAMKYCDDAQCKYPGKVSDLDFNEAYILTPFDWVEGINSAKKIGEEVFEGRSTWKVETNKGTLWLDNYYGVPLKVESEGNQYKYSQVAFNQVKDEEVVPIR